MKTRLNLATSPLVNHRRFLLGATLVGTLGGVLLIWQGWHAYKVRSDERARRHEIVRLDADLSRWRNERHAVEEVFARPETATLRDRVGFLNNLIEQRSFPWTRLFMDLEKNLPAGVRVVSISPKMAGGHIEIRLVVGAATDEVKLKFLRDLEQSREFSRIQLISESHPTRAGDPDRTVLELVAWYATT